MHLSVVGGGERVRGEVTVPNSKYHAHRALILASLAPGLSRISASRCRSRAIDRSRCCAGSAPGSSRDGDTFLVHGGPYRPREEPGIGRQLRHDAVLHARAGRPRRRRRHGDRPAVLPRRPVGPLLRCAGRPRRADLESADGCPPITVPAAAARAAGDVHIAGTLSPVDLRPDPDRAVRHQATTIRSTDTLNERRYVELTVRMMREFGLEVDRLRRLVAGSRSSRTRRRSRATSHCRPTSARPRSVSRRPRCTPPTSCFRACRKRARRGSDHPEADFLDIVAAMGLPMELDARGGRRARAPRRHAAAPGRGRLPADARHAADALHAGRHSPTARACSRMWSMCG